MRLRWKGLIQTVIVAVFIWISFNFFLFYWRSRKVSVPPMLEFQNGNPKLRPIRLYKTEQKYQNGGKAPFDMSVTVKSGSDMEWLNSIQKYRRERTELCNGRFTGFNNEFSFLKDVLISKSKASGRHGGEEIKAVLNQAEEREFYQFHPGFFKLQCTSPINYEFQLGHRNHINSYFNALSYYTNSQPSTPRFAENKTLFVVTRYEYVNFYHSMTDFYNAFLNMEVLGLRPDDIVILFADGHPRGGLDSVWSTLFSGFTRVGDIKDSEVLVKQMVWVQLSYASPLIAHNRLSIPATELFRHFFLQRYNISNTNRVLDCKKLRVTFIWRRDYLAHPRNPSGHVVRKIKNEEELVAEVAHELPNSVIVATQIDLLPMRKQLQIVTDTDILVGMHGAGLTHAMFLPAHAGLVEMYPTYWSEGNVHFKKIAEWRKLHYQRWVNHNPRLEYINHYTRIPAGVVSSMLRQVLHGMRCSRHHK